MAQQNTDMLDGLQAAVLADAQKKQAENKKEYEFDPLAMYFGEDFYVAGIKIVQPKIYDILDMGESKFYSGLSPMAFQKKICLKSLRWRRVAVLKRYKI